MADEWPLQTSLELGALPGAVPCARLHAKQVLWEWGLPVLSETVELLVSELVTNAVHASRALKWATPIGLWLLADQTRVVVAVWDACPKPPLRLHVDEETEGGRGLLLVESISDLWNWFRPEGLAGKVVWAEVANDGHAPGGP